MDSVRYIKKVDVGNPLRTYVDGQTIDIILPRNKVDISSFKLYYDVAIDPVYKYAVQPAISAFVPDVPDLVPFLDGTGATVAHNGPNMAMYDPNHRNRIVLALIPLEDSPGVHIPHVSKNVMTRGPLLPPQPKYVDADGKAMKDPDTQTPLYVPLIDPITNVQVLDDEGNPVFVVQKDGAGKVMLDPSTGTVTMLPAVAPLIEILDENGEPIPSEKLDTAGNTIPTEPNVIPNILMMIDPAFGYPGPALIDALDKFGKPIPNGPPHVVMMHDMGSFVPDVPPNPLPIPRPAGTTETYLKRFMPRLSSSIIDTLTIRRNGTVVQEIKDYNILYNILNDGLKEEDDLDSDKIDTLNYTTLGKYNKPMKVCDFANTTAPEAVAPLTYRYCISNFLGMIGECSSSNIDAGKNEIMISIKLAPKYITYQGIDIHNIDHTRARNIADRSHEFDYTYYISNVFGNISILPQSTNVPDTISFKHYKTVKGTQTDTKDTQLTHKHKGKLDYILSTFVIGGNHDTGLQLQQCNKNTGIFGVPFKKNYGDLRDFVRTPMTSQHVSAKMIKDLTTENNLDNSLYFSRQALNLRASQYTLNGQDITPRMDMPQMYAQAKEFFNGQMTRVQSLSSFESEFYVFPVVISQDDEKYVSEIEWKCFEGNNNDYALSYENKGRVYPIMYFVYYQKVYM